MKRRHRFAFAAAGALALGVGLSGVAAPAQAAPVHYDTILRHGVIFDGTGAPRFAGDIGVRDGHIAGIGDLTGATADTDLDMTGLFVAPGFINIHDHSTPEGLVRSENMLTQGVTTEIVNPDGYSPMDVPAQLIDYSAQGLATNVGGYIGFNTVWQEVMGMTDHRPTAQEIGRMRDLISRALTGGVWGASAGLDYKPGYFAHTDEVIQIVSAAKAWRTNFTNHDRLAPETGFSSLLGVGETIKIGESAGISPEVTHMKAQGHEQGKGPQILAMMSAASARGHYTPSDVYPYLAGESGLEALMAPAWALAGGRDKMLERFKDPATRARIVAEVEKAMNARFGGPKGVYLPDSKEELTDIMARLNAGPGEAVLQTLEKSPRIAILRFGAQSDLDAFLTYPDSAIACDCGAITNAEGHPRSFGTFPRVLGLYVRDRRLLTWENAIRKMSGLPATIIGMVDRGFLAPGMAADITVFDPKTVIDHSTFDHPGLLSEGVRYVLVNGRLALKDGKATGAQGGRPLRRSENMPTRPMAIGAAQVSGSAEVSKGVWDDDPPMRVSFNVSQGAGARHAAGRFAIMGADGKPYLSVTDFGLLQTADRWASFTAEARLASGADEAVTVILDKADPLAKDGKATLTIDGRSTHLRGAVSATDLTLARADQGARR